MANKVLLKKSSVAAKVPLAADLDYGEIALNYQDGKIYYKKADNSIDAFTSGSGGTAGVTSVAGNTGAVTAGQLLTAINTVDGSGSGLDADLLDGINGASLIRSDTADTFLNITSENGIESLKVGGYTTTAAIQASYSTSFAAQPMSTQIWHDLLAFSKNYTTTYETYNGTAWSSATVNKELFAQKENQTILITNGTTITRARWTFTNVAYSSADWLVIGHTYNAPNPNKTILVESSVDGITWFTKHNSTYDNHAVSMFHRLDPYYGDAYLRITITWNSGGDVRLSNIKLLTCRPGDQGKGVEDEFPYLADGNQNITTGGNLTIGAGKTFSSPTAIVSTLATGTAPFTIASTTLVNNLNSQYLNGQQSSYYLDTSATAQTKTGDLTITGNLTVNGTTTTINSTVLTVDDINIELGSIASPTDTTANGGGITLKGATDKTFNWVQSTGYWTASNSLSAPQHISTVAQGTAPLIVGSTTLVTNLNADLLDGLNSATTNTVSTIVARDASGNFAAGTITATLTGSASSVASAGTVTAETLTADAPAGLTFRQAYSNGYPTTYGNVISLGGAGHNQIFFGWSGTSGASADNYIRSQRDTGDANWSAWAKIWTDVNDGTGSGLDADLLDGNDSAYFINTSATAQTKAGNLTLTGALSATTKSFLITHPTKPDMKLRYGSLEGPENGVYVRGRLKGNKIELPDYWTKLVDPESITVNLTPIGKHQDLYVKSIENNTVTVANSNLVTKGIDCFYVVYGERCDVSKLEVEIAK